MMESYHVKVSSDEKYKDRKEKKYLASARIRYAVP